MTKYIHNCRTCQMSKGNVKFRNRVRKAAFNREEGDETLGDIALEVGISVHSIYRHAKKHLTTMDMTGKNEIRVAKKIIDMKKNSDNELAAQLGADTVDEIDARPTEIASLDDYIALCAAEVRAGKMKITANSFLGAVKIKTDWASKQQNNKIELLRTISAFRSGAKKEGKIDGNTIELTEGVDRGEDEPSIIFRSAFGYAAPQGTEEVPDGHVPPETED